LKTRIKKVRDDPKQSLSKKCNRIHEVSELEEPYKLKHVLNNKP